MILDSHVECLLLNIESYYLRITEINMYKGKQSCIHAFLHNSAITIATRFKYFQI